METEKMPGKGISPLVRNQKIMTSELKDMVAVIKGGFIGDILGLHWISWKTS
jgi:hypothetical protein